MSTGGRSNQALDSDKMHSSKDRSVTLPFRSPPPSASLPSSPGGMARGGGTPRLGRISTAAVSPAAAAAAAAAVPVAPQAQDAFLHTSVGSNSSTKEIRRVNQAAAAAAHYANSAAAEAEAKAQNSKRSIPDMKPNNLRTTSRSVSPAPRTPPSNRSSPPPPGGMRISPSPEQSQTPPKNSRGTSRSASPSPNLSPNLSPRPGAAGAGAPAQRGQAPGSGAGSAQRPGLKALLGMNAGREARAARERELSAQQDELSSMSLNDHTPQTSAMEGESSGYEADSSIINNTSAPPTDGPTSHTAATNPGDPLSAVVEENPSDVGGNSTTTDGPSGAPASGYGGASGYNPGGDDSTAGISGTSALNAAGKNSDIGTAASQDSRISRSRTRGGVVTFGTLFFRSCAWCVFVKVEHEATRIEVLTH